MSSFQCNCIIINEDDAVSQTPSEGYWNGEEQVQMGTWRSADASCCGSKIGKKDYVNQDSAKGKSWTGAELGKAWENSRAHQELKEHVYCSSTEKEAVLQQTELQWYHAANDGSGRNANLDQVGWGEAPGNSVLWFKQTRVSKLTTALERTRWSRRCLSCGKWNWN